MSNDTLKRLAMWVGGSTLQYGCLYVGVKWGDPVLTGIGLTMTWLNIVGVFFVAIAFSQITKDFAKKRQPMTLGNSPTPMYLDAVLDTGCTLFLLYHGFYLTGVAYAAHTFLLIPIRLTSRKYNKGLVQLSPVGESKLKF